MGWGGRTGGSFRVSGAGKHPALGVAERDHMSRSCEILGAGRGVREEPCGECSVVCGDAGGCSCGGMGWGLAR